MQETPSVPWDFPHMACPCLSAPELSEEHVSPKGLSREIGATSSSHFRLRPNWASVCIPGPLNPGIEQ